MWCIPWCTWLAGHLGRLCVLLLSCTGMSLTWKQIEWVVHVEKMETGLKPIVRENHFIFAPEPLAFNCPFPSSNVCTVLPWSLFPLACGQNDRRSGFRIRLTEVTKPVTKRSMFGLDDMLSPLKWPWCCSVPCFEGNIFLVFSYLKDCLLVFGTFPDLQFVFCV